MDEMKSQFVSTVSHELRTPLTSIAVSLGLLSGGVAGVLPDEASRLIGIAQSNCQRLVRLINDILDIEKLESGQMTLHLERVNLRELAMRLIDAVSGMASDHKVRVELDDGATATVMGGYGTGIDWARMHPCTPRSPS
jgi:signal transduction histidine kinase